MGNRKWVHSSTYYDEQGKKHIYRIYSIWNNMINRCINPNASGYINYGGRGITVCEEWLSYDNFYEWAMSNGYEDNLTIDRIEVNGNYTPDNCKWATMIEQANNTRRNVMIDGLTMAEYSKANNISYALLQTRNRRGQSLKEPRQRGNRICDGMTLSEISLKYGFNYATLTDRWRKGARTLEELLKPLDNRGSYRRGR